MTNANELIHSFNSTQDSEGNFYGLTKREYFAAMAMQGLLANNEVRQIVSGNNGLQVPKHIAQHSTDMADALINALNEAI